MPWVDLESQPQSEHRCGFRLSSSGVANKQQQKPNWSALIIQLQTVDKLSMSKTLSCQHAINTRKVTGMLYVSRQTREMRCVFHTRARLSLEWLRLRRPTTTAWAAEIPGDSSAQRTTVIVSVTREGSPRPTQETSNPSESLGQHLGAGLPRAQGPGPGAQVEARAEEIGVNTWRGAHLNPRA